MMPPPEYRPYYAGWDNSKTVPLSTRSIHHPKGDVKKISIDYDPPGIASYNTNGYLPNSFWWIKKWDIGTTEAGSSGGPLFSNENLLIGSLTGGTATCDHSTDDYYSMMFYQWKYSSLAARQLKKWLDPSNSGVVKIEAMDPYASGATCDQFSDVRQDETYIAAKISGGRGYISGHNSEGITSYAQEFNTTEKTTLSAFSAGFAKASTGVDNSNSNVVFQIYTVNENTGLPGNVLKSIKMPIRSLKAQTMNFIVLDQPLNITGKYFIGYDINYNNKSDTVAVYHAPSRTGNNLNRAYCIVDRSWQPFYWVPVINLKTSLLINSYGCATTFAQVIPEPVPNGNPQFKVYYPNDPSLNILYLINTGAEEYGRIVFYDLMGRKVSETERMLTTEPMELNCSQMESAVYCIAIVTAEKREVVKVRVIRSR
jgi:hypothetical protein